MRKGAVEVESVNTKKFRRCKKEKNENEKQFFW